ncbi:MAG TPA: MFS transporter [Micromonosporaceae bacterium]|nr:MFS transporter [Micromonosporaceae bacterium]
MSDVVSAVPARPEPPTSTRRRQPPATVTRQAGPVQAALLLVTSCLVVLGAVLIAPVQPRIAAAFAGQPGVDLLVPITLTMPALMIALMAPFAGRLIDSMGRIRIFTITLVLYAVFGTAPLWLDSLPLIVASRAGVGIAEAAIITCSTTLLADYWTGVKRNRILGLQVVATSVSAVLFIGIGGALGATSWRAPFAVYGISLVLAVLVPLVLWQPPELPRRAASDLPPVDWRQLAIPCAVTFFGGITFYVPIAELSFRLDGIGVTDTAIIGGISAIAAVATAIGAIVFGRVAPRGPATLLPIAFGLAGVGIVVLGAFDTVPMIMVGAVIASAGCGLLLPTLLTWALSTLNGEQRGRGTGLWNGCLFIGQFICPIVVLAIGGVTGGMGPALVIIGVLSIVLAVAARPLARRSAARAHADLGH